jgi:phosphoribosylamine--glycine ligase
MGAYSPLPWLSHQFGGEEEFVDLVTRDVAEPVIRTLDEEGTPFIGLLYAGLILTDSGVKVIEFNARFGDPETQVVLPRLVDPLSELLLAAASGHLEDLPRPAFAEAVAVTVVLASEGYPQSPVTGRELHGLDAASAVEGVHLAHAATAEKDGGLVATGGRVLNVVGLGTTFAEARDRTYRALSEISLEGGQHRTDIAARVVEA